MSSLWGKLVALVKGDAPHQWPGLCPAWETMDALGRGMPRRGFVYLGCGWDHEDIWADENNRFVYSKPTADGSLSLQLYWRGRCQGRYSVATPAQVRDFLAEL